MDFYSQNVSIPPLLDIKIEVGELKSVFARYKTKWS